MEAELYFVTYKALLDDVENSLTSVSSSSSCSVPLTLVASKIKDHSDENSVDVRCFALFMGLQLFSQQAKFSTELRSNYASTPWPNSSPGGSGSSSSEERRAGIHSSPLSSPRSKATKVNYSLSEYQIILHFVKNSLRLFLRLISSDSGSGLSRTTKPAMDDFMKGNSTNLSQTTVLPMTEPLINAKEFDALRVLFRVQKGGRKHEQLSQLTPFFQGPAASPKITVGDAIKWLTAVLEPSDPGSP